MSVTPEYAERTMLDLACLAIRASNQIGGWREMIALLDDKGLSEVEAKAMWAALNQIDEWRKLVRQVINEGKVP